MNRNEELKKLKEEYKDIEVPEIGAERMQSAIRRAKMDKKRDRKKRLLRNWGIGVAAALVIAALPNTNENIAYAMGNLPVIGGLFRVITVREFTHNDGNYEANVKVPVIISEDAENSAESEAIEHINKSVEEYTNELISQFEADMEEEGHKGLDISYETVMDNDKWFTLKVTALEVQASSYQVQRFYHVDKMNGKVAELNDLFSEGADYISPISEEIKKQMKEQIDAETGFYFLENDEYVDGFIEIGPNQNFYLNEDGNIVIVFDEYEVAPGYMGNPEFIIPAEVVSSIRK